VPFIVSLNFLPAGAVYTVPVFPSLINVPVLLFMVLIGVSGYVPSSLAS